MTTKHQNQKPLERLADEALSHLTRERVLMQKIVDQSAQLRADLLQRDFAAVQATTEQLQELQQQVDRLSTYRGHLRQAISVAMGLAADTQATLRQLARRVDKSRQKRLLQARQQLVDLSSRAGRLQYSNLTIAAAYLQISDRMFESITGQSRLAYYGKTGRLDANEARPMFQTDL